MSDLGPHPELDLEITYHADPGDGLVVCWRRRGERRWNRRVFRRQPGMELGDLLRWIAPLLSELDRWARSGYSRQVS